MSKVQALDEEYEFEDKVIISQTDLKGVITYVNRAFCETSWYSTDELIGQEHNIIRHPDMPKAVFEKMWSSIQGGRSWNGLIKNLRKDGQYYWIDLEILPTKDDNNIITGYIAVGKSASKKDISENIAMYQKMLNAEG
jgi:aerotaxis receptor